MMSVSEITESRQYLTFRLGDEIFGTDVAKVREVLDFTEITKIPRTPDFMSGVINLRGSVVPVVDLRLCFHMSRTERTKNTCIVVVEVMLQGESTVIGALTDSVVEVINMEPDQIQPAPRIGTQIKIRVHQGHGPGGIEIRHDSRHRPSVLGRSIIGGAECGRSRTGRSERLSRCGEHPCQPVEALERRRRRPLDQGFE
jgi:purine-binding chemotaxis protein CheW